MKQDSIHENFSRPKKEEIGSERSFGLIMAAALALLAAVNFWHQKQAWPWLSVGALFFAMSGIFAPAMLRHPNKLWHRFGLLLHAVVNPIVMGIVFYVAIWPTGLILRLRHKDLLRLKRHPEYDTYWIVRQPPGPAPETMKDQF